jgi:hypothetical protein
MWVTLTTAGFTAGEAKAAGVSTGCVQQSQPTHSGEFKIFKARFAVFALSSISDHDPN